MIDTRSYVNDKTRIRKHIFEVFESVLMDKLAHFRIDGNINKLEFENQYNIMIKFGVPNEHLQKLMNELIVHIVHEL